MDFAEAVDAGRCEARGGLRKVGMVGIILCRKMRVGMDPPLQIGFGRNYGAAWACPF